MKMLGTNIFFLSHITAIPKVRIVTYARVMNQVCITVGGNLVTYTGELITRTADLVTTKNLQNSMLCTLHANYFIATPLDHFKHVHYPQPYS